MSATQTLCDAFEYLSSGVDCPYGHDACRCCPIYAVADESDDASCQETFARLLKESREEEWRGSARKFGRGDDFCSLCGAMLEPGQARCDGCGAVLL